MPSLSAILGFLVPSAMALQVGPESIAILCGFLPCTAGGGGAAGLSAYAVDKIIVAFEIGVIAAAVISLLVAAVQLVMFGSQENTASEARSSYIYIITGLAIVGLARWFAIAFSSSSAGTALANVEVVEEGISNVVTYFRLIIAVTLLVNVVVQAFRMISSQGEQEQVDKAKNRLIAGFIGAGVILIGNAIVVALLPGSGATIIALEMAGIANYLVTILGFIALLAIVVAGILLIVSVDEGLKDKAKTIIKTAIVALLAVLFSYALVTAFIAL